MAAPQEITATAPDTATKAKPYVCLTCTRPFARLEHLKRHERSHTKEKPFCCDQAGTIPGCGRYFARRDLLLRHQQKIHLFPNTSKRRRLSSVSQVSAQTQPSIKSASPTVERQQFTLSIPNLDDLTNFENGTVNPSSIYSSSPPSSAHNNMPHFIEPQGLQQTPISPVGDFSYATEKLFPPDVETIHTSHVAPLELWSLPELMKSGSSPSSSISSQYSPPSTYNSLGRHASLEQAGNDSELFPQDFFVGSGAYLRQYNTHQRSHSMPISQAQAQAHSQLYLNNQLEAMNQRTFQKRGSYPTEDLINLQYAGGEMAYCNGFRPSDGVYNALNYVETF